MAYVDQAKAVLDNLSNNTLTNQQMVDLVKNYLVVDDATDTRTNEELAEAFITTMRNNAKIIVRRGAEKRQLITAAAIIDAADNDLSPPTP